MAIFRKVRPSHGVRRPRLHSTKRKRYRGIVDTLIHEQDCKKNRFFIRVEAHVLSRMWIYLRDGASANRRMGTA